MLRINSHSSMDLSNGLLNLIISTESGRDVIRWLNLVFLTQFLSRSIRAFFDSMMLLRYGKIWQILSILLTFQDRISFLSTYGLCSRAPWILRCITRLSRLSGMNLMGADCVSTFRNCDCCKVTDTKADHAKIVIFGWFE